MDDEMAVVRKRLQECMRELGKARDAKQALLHDPNIPPSVRRALASGFARVDWSLAGVDDSTKG